MKSAPLPASNSDPKEQTNPFAEAKRKLLPPLQNRMLAEASAALIDGHPDVAEPLVTRFLKKHPRSHEALNLKADIAPSRGTLRRGRRHYGPMRERGARPPRISFQLCAHAPPQKQIRTALEQIDTLLEQDRRNQ